MLACPKRNPWQRPRSRRTLSKQQPLKVWLACESASKDLIKLVRVGGGEALGPVGAASITQTLKICQQFASRVEWTAFVEHRPPWIPAVRSVAKPVRLAYCVRVMGRNRKWNVIVWTVLGAYLTLALLPTGAIVYCISESGHSAIEFAHDGCPQATCTDASVRPVAVFSKQSSGCTDTKIAFSTDHLRKPINQSLTLLPKTFVGIRPNLPTYQIHHDPACKFSDRPPQDHRPVKLLRTVVLLI